MSKKILITGGPGFIGHQAVKRFLGFTDYEILVIDRLSYAGDLNRINEVEIKMERIERNLKKIIENQEFVGNRGDNPYWEGACSVLNTNGEEIGRAYLELAGYGGGLGARLN
mgnify:CR=1 FL=1